MALGWRQIDPYPTSPPLCVLLGHTTLLARGGGCLDLLGLYAWAPIHAGVGESIPLPCQAMIEIVCPALPARKPNGVGASLMGAER